MNVTNSLIIDNNAAGGGTGDGGGIYNNCSGMVGVVGSTIVNNLSGDRGAGYL